ncbi:Cell division protein FtsX [invertebrate metagenome]|uniref:Cell division protein FtsX n=1 Tax=invertebrate metagenome TaxID=1711999 RepID=A0A2H9TBU0_9ZZZZ
MKKRFFKIHHHNKHHNRTAVFSDKNEGVDTSGSTKRGARRYGRISQSLSVLLGLHGYMAREALKKMGNSPLTSLMSSIMIALAFALPALLYLLVINLQSLGQGWEGTPSVSLYLAQNIDASDISHIKDSLQKLPDIAEIYYISAAQGLDDLRSKVDVGSVVEELGFNPLPNVYRVIPVPGMSYRKMEDLADNLSQIPDVETVKLDKKWVQRLQAIVNIFRYGTIVLAVLFAAVVLLSVSNTVLQYIENAQSEIQVIKLVGGTDGFITLPFFYMGVFYGLFGAFLAMIVVWSVLSMMMPYALELSGLYESSFVPKAPGGSLFFLLLLSGALLGGSGAIVSSRKFLRHIL